MHSGGHQVSAFGACILDAEGLRLTAQEKKLFSEFAPFGFILFARNIESPAQVKALCAEMRDAAGHNAPITIDQEGGRVQRLRGPVWRDWVPPLDQVGGADGRAEEAMYLRYRIIASELFDLGIDSNCAPLVDVPTADTHTFLTNRCYAFDPAAVARIGRSVADGLLDGGVLPIIKHIPGHGRAVTDSHHALPSVDTPHNQLSQTDFATFAALNDLPMGMTAHVVYSAIDAKPATLSPDVMTVIRSDIGFDGLIMTDDISMKALEGSVSDISRAALAAGCDVILHCNGTLEARRAVAEAAGRLSDIGQSRAERALGARRTPTDVDIPALEAKLRALMDDGGHD